MKITQLASLTLLLSLASVRGDETRTPDSESWTGIWETSYGQLVVSTSPDGEVRGYYGPLEHQVIGWVDPEDSRFVIGHWQHRGSDSVGTFRFCRTGVGRFDGVWGWGEEGPTHFWSGTRSTDSEPEKTTVIPLPEDLLSGEPVGTTQYQKCSALRRPDLVLADRK